MNHQVKQWEILKRRTVYRGTIFDVEEKDVRSPRTGQTMCARTIRCKDWVMVLPLTPDNEVVMVRQYRHGLESVCLEFPGGIVDEGDASPESAARRELLEETGYEAADFVRIGETHPQPAILDNKGIFFLARHVRRVQDAALDPGEDMEIVNVPYSRLNSLAVNGEIQHGMVLLALFFHQRHLQNHSSYTFPTKP